LNGPRASQQIPDRHQSHHITSLRQETKLPSSSSCCCCCYCCSPPPPPAAPPALPSTRCAAALLHPPPTTTLTRLPFDAPVNPSNPRPVSPSITYFSYCSPSPPICCPRVLVAKRLDISDPITSISLHAHLACLLLLHLHLQPWCRPSVQLLAWRAAAKRPLLTSESNLQA
jgi:hypothetical protein